MSITSHKADRAEDVESAMQCCFSLTEGSGFHHDSVSASLLSLNDAHGCMSLI